MRYIILFFTFLTCFQLQAANNHGLVQWHTFEEVDSLSKNQPKPILIDFHTSWCGWCKRMVATTYSDPNIANYINNNFYAIQFDAETNDTITFQGKTYTNPGVNNATRSMHSLARVLMNGSGSYPTTMFMSQDRKVPMLVPGYLKPNEMASFLVYFQEKLYLNTDINTFREDFKWTFEQEDRANRETADVNWVSLSQAFELNKNGDKKKIMVFLDHPQSVTSKIMDSTTFTDPVISAYLNENYHAVKFDVFSTEEININGQQLTGGGNGTFHQLVVAGTNNQPKFPCILMFNEENMLITPIPQYMNADFTEVVLSFFKEDQYLNKETTFNEYKANFEAKQAK